MSSHQNSSKKSMDFLGFIAKVLEVDCDDVDLPEKQPKPKSEEEIRKQEECNNRNKKNALENPFLKDYFTQLRERHKSKKFWFNR